MVDHKKVIEGLEWILKDDRFGFGVNWETGESRDEYEKAGKIITDTIALLKEREPIKPTVSVDTWICSKCGHTLESQELIDDKEYPQVLIHEQYQYCPICGRKVKWE